MATESLQEPPKEPVTPPSGVDKAVSLTTADSSPTKAGNTVPTTPSRRENNRPKSIGRQPSGSIIIPRDAVPMPTPQGEYPPDDARAMSPRRTSEETDKLGEETRMAVQKHARTLQDGLSAIADKIEEVKLDNAKLERDNLALQDYIGGLTQSMSRTNLPSSSSSAGPSGTSGKKK